jgi:hypothetical protein
LHAASAAAWHFAAGFHGVVLVCVLMTTAAVSRAARNKTDRTIEQQRFILVLRYSRSIDRSIVDREYRRNVLGRRGYRNRGSVQ